MVWIGIIAPLLPSAAAAAALGCDDMKGGHDFSRLIPDIVGYPLSSPSAHIRLQRFKRRQ